MKKTGMDLLDYQILEILQQDARLSNKELAEKIGLSPAPTLMRVKKLVETGVIKGSSIQVNHEAVGLGCNMMLSLIYAVGGEDEILPLCVEDPHIYRYSVETHGLGFEHRYVYCRHKTKEEAEKVLMVLLAKLNQQVCYSVRLVEIEELIEKQVSPMKGL